MRRGEPERGKEGPRATWLDEAPPGREEREREVAADREEIREADRCRRVAESRERIAARWGATASARAGESGRSESIVL